MKIKYRMAELNDLDNIFRLVKSSIDTMTKQNILQWDEVYPAREHLENDIIKKQLYLGEIDDHIAVLYVLNQDCDEQYKNGKWQYQGEDFYIIHRLCVNPVFQNKGIAKKTLLHIEQELKNINIHNIRLDAYSKNPFALRLYNNLGYSKRGSADWRKGIFYLMEKHF